MLDKEKKKDKCFHLKKKKEKKKVQHFTEWRFIVLLSELWDWTVLSRSV